MFICIDFCDNSAKRFICWKQTEKSLRLRVFKKLVQLPGWHIRVNPVSTGVGSHILKLWAILRKAVPITHLTCGSMGGGELFSSLSQPSTSRVGGRPGSMVQRVREPTLLAQVWLSQPRSCKHGKAAPICYLADRPYICSDYNPELWLGLPQYPSHLWSARACEGTWPAGPKLQYLHNSSRNWRLQTRLMTL